MQPTVDRVLIEACGVGPDEITATEGLHPREIMAAAGRCDVMVAMRLHALIFAAAQNAPCVAINYDPKVASLAAMIGAPLISSSNDAELAKLPAAIAAARPIAPDLLAKLRRKARYNAELAVGLKEGGRRQEADGSGR